MQARRVQEEIVKAYEAYQFHLIYQKIHHFCTIELGSFYLDIIKDRQYTTQTIVWHDVLHKPRFFILSKLWCVGLRLF